MNKLKVHGTLIVIHLMKVLGTNVSVLKRDVQDASKEYILDRFLSPLKLSSSKLSSPRGGLAWSHFGFDSSLLP